MTRQRGALSCSEAREKVSHEVLFVVVGQDFGDVPVSGGQGLKYVHAAVGLECLGKGETGWGGAPGFLLLFTRDVDMEMWKNFPLPP